MWRVVKSSVTLLFAMGSMISSPVGPVAMQLALALFANIAGMFAYNIGVFVLLLLAVFEAAQVEVRAFMTGICDVVHVM